MVSKKIPWWKRIKPAVMTQEYKVKENIGAKVKRLIFYGFKIKF